MADQEPREYREYRNPDREYNAVLELVKTVREETRIGIAEIKQAIREQNARRDDNCKAHSDRLGAIETWKATVGGAYGAVATLAALVGAVVSAVVAWITGKH